MLTIQPYTLYHAVMDKAQKPLRRRTTAAQRSEMVAMYESGLSSWKIHKATGFSDKAIINNLRANGVKIRPRRRYTLNQDAFAVDSEEASYWTGFLMADGCIAAKNEVRLMLADRDIGHLEKFRTFLNSGRPIYRIKSRPMNKIPYTASPAALVAVCSEKLCLDLANRGVVRSKTFRTTPGRFADDRHFWRGIIDGDGCIGFTKTIKNYPSVQLVGSFDIVAGFVDFVAANCCKSKARPRKRKNIYIVGFSGRAAVAIAKHLYSDCKTFLQRKYAKAEIVASTGIGIVGYNFPDGKRPTTDYKLNVNLPVVP